MNTYGSIFPGAAKIARWAQKTNSLTAKARYRIKMLDWHRNHGKNISLTARRFGLTRLTVRTWIRRFNRGGIIHLNDKSKRPRNLRKPATPTETVIEIIKIRKKYPAWSKYKIKQMLDKRQITVSASTIGRVLKRNQLIDKRIARIRRKASAHPKARFPRGFRISKPGDMIQIDTKYVNLIGGRRIYQFTAIDVLTKQRALKYYPSLTSDNGADFLKHCLDKFSFKVRTIQTDNGPEFMKNFEKLCQKLKLPHFYIYPRIPKQNTYVENSHGSDKKEFYQQGKICQSINAMQEKLLSWETVWNTVRPHQALNYLTPQEYFLKWKNGNLPTKDVITLQT